VGENVKYGLKARQVPAGEIDRRAHEALAGVGLAAYADRSPGQLSGGQQQRVALARALVTRPSVLLMDEPLSNLDARLRVQMRTEVRRIVKEAGITTVYVTHDQEEALAISDRIAVMEGGRVVQVGSPVEVYRTPASKQVAAFVGACSFLAGSLAGGELRFAGQRVRVPARYEGPVVVGIRPEAIGLGLGPVTLTGEVVGESFLGPVTRLEVRLASGETVAVNAARPPAGGRVTLGLLPADLLLFRADSGEALR
jgi:ABC-type Fe3+/spermidine/putrescine transport system ATPase subunit